MTATGCPAIGLRRAIEERLGRRRGLPFSCEYITRITPDTNCCNFEDKLEKYLHCKCTPAISIMLTQILNLKHVLLRHSIRRIFYYSF